MEQFYTGIWEDRIFRLVFIKIFGMNRTMRGHSRYGTVKAHQIVCKFYK